MGKHRAPEASATEVEGWPQGSPIPGLSWGLTLGVG